VNFLIFSPFSVFEKLTKKKGRNSERTCSSLLVEQALGHLAALLPVGVFLRLDCMTAFARKISDDLPVHRQIGNQRRRG